MERQTINADGYFNFFETLVLFYHEKYRKMFMWCGSGLPWRCAIQNRVRVIVTCVVNGLVDLIWRRTVERM